MNANFQTVSRCRSGALAFRQVTLGHGLPHIEHLNDPILSRLLLIHQLLKRNSPKVIENQRIKLYPQIVRHAFLVIMTIFLSIALRRIYGLIDSKDDLGNRNLPHVPGKAIASSWSSHAVNQRALAKLRK